MYAQQLSFYQTQYVLVASILIGNPSLDLFSKAGFAIVLQSIASQSIVPSYGILISNIVSVIAIIVAVIYLVATVGLLQMKNWGRILALIIGILSIIGGIIGLIFIVGLIPLVFGIIVVVYLSGDVKHEFE